MGEGQRERCGRGGDWDRGGVEVVTGRGGEGNGKETGGDKKGEVGKGGVEMGT